MRTEARKPATQSPAQTIQKSRRARTPAHPVPPKRSGWSSRATRSRTSTSLGPKRLAAFSSRSWIRPDGHGRDAAHARAPQQPVPAGREVAGRAGQDEDDVRIVLDDPLALVEGPLLRQEGGDVRPAGPGDEVVDVAFAAARPQPLAVEQDEDLRPDRDVPQGRVHGVEPAAQVRGEPGGPAFGPGDPADPFDEREQGFEALADVADEDRQAELAHAVDEPEGIAPEGDDEVRIERPDDLDAGIDEPADPGDGGRRRRIVAEPGHADDPVAEAEGEEDLGDVRGHGDDPLRRPRGQGERPAEVVLDDSAPTAGRAANRTGPAQNAAAGFLTAASPRRRARSPAGPCGRSSRMSTSAPKISRMLAAVTVAAGSPSAATAPSLRKIRPVGVGRGEVDVVLGHDDRLAPVPSASVPRRP